MLKKERNERERENYVFEDLRFSYASTSAGDDEPQHADVMYWVGLNEADRVRRKAIRYNNQGDLIKAHASVEAALKAMAPYAAHSQALQRVTGAVQHALPIRLDQLRRFSRTG